MKGTLAMRHNTLTAVAVVLVVPESSGLGEHKGIRR